MCRGFIRQLSLLAGGEEKSVFDACDSEYVKRKRNSAWARVAEGQGWADDLC